MTVQYIQLEPVAAPAPLIISELLAGTVVRGWLLVVEIQNRVARNGKSYRHMKLRDQRGNTITARQFDLSRNETLVPQVRKVVLIEGVVEEFNGETILKLSRAQLDEAASPDLFLLRTRRPMAQIEEDFQKLISKVYDAGLYELLQRCFTASFMECFRYWPAAVQHHGAVTGGLIEHTVNVTLIADRLAQLYACNSDMVLAGALLHDIGKLEELEEEVGAGFTERGHMFGHIILGAQYVQKQAELVPEMDEATLADLLHIILAHHGTKEYGSPVCPATIEALIVHLADTTEAKLTGFFDHCERTSSMDGWSSYSATFGGQLRMP